MFDRVLWLSGMPRSGTTWVAQILSSHPDVRLKYDPLFSYKFKNSMTSAHGVDDWHALFRSVYQTEDPYMDHTAPKRDKLVPDFPLRAVEPPVLAIKSNRHHDLIGRAVELGVAARFLFLVRDPLDTIASWLSNPTEFPEDAKPEEEWRTGACRKTGPGEYWGFNDWVHVTTLQLNLAQRFPDRVMMLKYEDIVEAPEVHCESIFGWIGLEMSNQSRGFLQESGVRHSDHPRSVFRAKGRRVSQRKALPACADQEMVAALLGTPLSQFLRPTTESKAVNGD